MNKVMKFEIIKPLDTEWKILGSILRELRYNTFKALNKSIQIFWEWDNFASEYKKEHGDYPKRADNQKILDGYANIDGYLYDQLKDEFVIFNKGNFTQTLREAKSKWNSNKVAVWKGEKSIPSFRMNSPIDVNANNIKIEQTEKGYSATLSLVSAETLKSLGRKRGGIPVAIKAGDGTQKAILNRIISGEYKVTGSQIIFNERRRKWFLHLGYSFEAEEKELDPNNIMGIDLGVVIPVYMAFNNSWKRYSIGGGEITQFRRQVERRRNSISRQIKYSGGGRKGHGRNTALEPLETISNKISNFRDTTNHKYSRYIVDMAIKHNCGTIQMEDLTGISTDNLFLKNWTYYDLQQKIDYKAKEAGIHVVKIDPKYTSQRCSNCGYIHRENRETQAEFKCVQCDFKANVDYNAARNIATPDIENIIKRGKEEQEQQIKQMKLLA